MIDYAGLFPPAKLSLSSAFSNFLEYRKGNYEQMLSRFICPLKLLSDLKDIISQTSVSNKILISALSTGGNSISDFKNNFHNDLISWRNFVSDKINFALINSFEARLPDEIFMEKDNNEISALIDHISAGIKEINSNPALIFLEGCFDKNWKDNSAYLIDAIDIHNLNEISAGFKLRTGGVTADSFPDSDQIAFCIRRCLDKKVPMKFTAGLHHPFRHYDKNIGTMMHGFINVFGAGIIAMRHDISNTGIQEILNDEEPGSFNFTDDCFSWKDWKIDIDDIEFARKNLVLSFGSCSFDEPVDDLRSLNLL